MTDDMERLPRFVQPLDYFLLLFTHMDTGGTVREEINNIKSCFTALGVRVKGVITHTVSPQVKEKGLSRGKWVLQIVAQLVSYSDFVLYHAICFEV